MRVQGVDRVLHFVSGMSLNVNSPPPPPAPLSLSQVVLPLYETALMDSSCVRGVLIIIIMYIYHALINALSAHIIHTLTPSPSESYGS